MQPDMALLHPERIHPLLWRASQLAPGGPRYIPSGYDTLNDALGGGWPLGALIELLPEHAGIGEVHLVRPALMHLTDRRQPIVLLNPPHTPSMQCWAAWGLNPDDVIWVSTSSPADTAWAATQVLNHQSSAALLCWAGTIAYADLLQLHRLARRSATLTILYRPRAAAIHDSPARLRIALHATYAGIETLFLKCPGPRPPVRGLTLYPHAHALDQSAPAAAPGRLPGAAGIPVSPHTAPGHA